MHDDRTVLPRIGILDGVSGLPRTPAISIGVLPPMARFALRLSPTDAVRLVKIGGLDLTRAINHTSVAGDRSAARLGPDEWLLTAPLTEGAALQAELTTALAGAHHALVDISHRNVAIEITGSAAADVLNAGCPLDLSSGKFASGACTRTLLGKAEIVLIRREAGPGFHLECWRSFGRYVVGFLQEAATEFA